VQAPLQSIYLRLVVMSSYLLEKPDWATVEVRVVTALFVLVTDRAVHSDQVVCMRN